jgi:integrase
MGVLGDKARARAAMRTGPPPSNDAIVAAWAANLKATKAQATHRNYTQRVHVFLGALGDEPLVKCDWDYMDSYVEDILIHGERGCSMYVARGLRQAAPHCRLGLALEGCRLDCPQRVPVDRGTIEAHLDALASLFGYIHQKRWISANVAAEYRKFWKHQNKFAQAKPAMRRFTVEEVERLLRLTRQPNRRTAFAIMALLGVRIEEAQRLRADPKHFNLDEGWIIVPFRPGQKRRGEDKLWMIEELQAWLHVYMQWRDRHIQRLPDGAPAHEGLLITARGHHWTNYNTLLDAWHEQLERVGILQGDEDATSTLVPHDLRHWMTTELENAGAGDYLKALFRGDKRAVISDEYTHLTDEQKRRKFLQYAPRVRF